MRCDPLGSDRGRARWGFQEYIVSRRDRINRSNGRRMAFKRRSRDLGDRTSEKKLGGAVGSIPAGTSLMLFNWKARALNSRSSDAG